MPSERADEVAAGGVGVVMGDGREVVGGPVIEPPGKLRQQPVEPGDQLFLEVEVLRTKRDIWVFSGKAKVDGKVVAAATRRPPRIQGTGQATIRELIEKQSRRRQAATDGESNFNSSIMNLSDFISNSRHSLR